MFEQVFVGGDYNFELPFVPQTIIDAGANAGYASLFFAAKFPEAKIIAVEPDGENFELLKRNIAAFPRIEALQAGLWGGAGWLDIQEPSASKCMISMKSAEVKTEGSVPALTVLDLLRRFADGKVDLLKMDIEGAELEVFASGAREWIPKVRALMIELHDWRRPGCAQALYDALHGTTFQQFSRGDVLLLIFAEPL